MKKWTATLVSLQVMLFSGGLYAQEAERPSVRDNMWQTVVMIGIALLFFYFILWRPEQKRRQALESQRTRLKKGDRVTAMGIIGTVSRVQDQTVILKMYDGAKIEVLLGAITDVSSGTGSEAEKKSE